MRSVGQIALAPYKHLNASDLDTFGGLEAAIRDPVLAESIDHPGL